MLPNPPAHNNNFDFLRFLFASFVIFTHSYILLGATNLDPVLRYTGRELSEIGVCGFFVISGYLIQQSLERSSSLLSFFRKRLFRIFPGLAVAVLLTTLLLGPLVSTLPATAYFGHPDTLRYLVKNIGLLPQACLPGVFTRNTETAVNGSLWTLRYEVLFYILSGVLYPFTLSRRRLITQALPLVYLAAYFTLRYEMIILTPGLHHFCIYLSILGCYYTGGAALSYFKPVLQQHKTWLLTLSALLFFCCLLLQHPAAEPIGIISFSVMVITFGLHYFPALHFSRYTGDISYGTYIYAYPLQQALIVWLAPEHIATLMLPSFLLSWLAGWLSWHLVEKRFLQQKKSGAATG